MTRPKSGRTDEISPIPFQIFGTFRGIVPTFLWRIQEPIVWSDGRTEATRHVALATADQRQQQQQKKNSLYRCLWLPEKTRRCRGADSIVSQHCRNIFCHNWPLVKTRPRPMMTHFFDSLTVVSSVVKPRLHLLP